MNGGVFGDFSGITCTTPASADAFGFAKINTPYDATTAKVASVCKLETLSQGSGYASRGSFMVDGNGNFVNSAGTAVASGDFETTADTGVSAHIYYLNAVSIWTYIKDKSSAPEATLVRLSFGFSYCFDAVAAVGTTCTLGSDTSGALTATTASSEIIFTGTPAAAGQYACVFTITPSSTMDVKITTSGTAPTMACAHQTAASTYVPITITTNADTTFSNAISVTCANSALSTSQNTGSMVAIEIVAATTTTTGTTTTTTASTSTSTSTTSASEMCKVTTLITSAVILLSFIF